MTGNISPNSIRGKQTLAGTFIKGYHKRNMDMIIEVTSNISKTDTNLGDFIIVDLGINKESSLAYLKNEVRKQTSTKLLKEKYAEIQSLFHCNAFLPYDATP